MGGFIKFEKMITPLLIHLVFWLGVLGSIVSGIFMIIFGFISDSGGMGQVFIGLVTMFFGPIVVRVYCELLIVVFKIQGALLSIRDSLKNGSGMAPTSSATTPSASTSSFEEELSVPTDDLS